MKAWKESHIAEHLAAAARQGLPATLTLSAWLRTVDDFRGCCAYCGNPGARVLEHFVPVARGGGTTASNCLPACKSCNSRKCRRHPDALESVFGADALAELRRYLDSRHDAAAPQWAPRQSPAPTTPFGERLREAREKGRLSMRELAEAASLPMANVPDAKITHTPVSLIESGRQTTVDVVTAVRLARALGVTVEWLVTGEQS